MNGDIDTAALPSLSVTVETPSAALQLGGQNLSDAIVTVDKEIAGTHVGPGKRHMKVELPAGTTYRTGDYIVVQPINPMSTRSRALTLFKLHPDDVIRISGTTKAFLIENKPTTAIELIGARLELATPVSRHQLKLIGATNSDKEQRERLETLASDECNVGFDAFLDWMKPLAPRQYSISSPLASGDPTNSQDSKLTASITYDIHSAPAFSGHDRIFGGVASTYLATRPVSSKIRCCIRPTNAAFHMPADLSTPLIMVCAGSGIAPMRGLCQEGAEIMKANGTRKLGKAILHFGCRDSETDFIYADELAEWEKLGAVEVRPVFSRSGPGHDQYKYVPERMWAEREEISTLFRGGAKILLCGSAGKLGRSNFDVCKKIWLERNPDRSEADAEMWLDDIKEERYVSDVFD